MRQENEIIEKILSVAMPDDSIRNKVTYLVGNDDPFRKFGGRQALIDNHMNTEFYDGAGHGLNHEFADEINKRIIEEFMK